MELPDHAGRLLTDSGLLTQAQLSRTGGRIRRQLSCEYAWPVSARQTWNCCADTKAASAGCSDTSLSVKSSSVQRERSWIGRRVVAEINIGCGHCSRCRGGLGKHCRQRKVIGIWKHDGAFADYLTVPIANLHPVPDELSDESAVFTEPLAAAFEVLEQVPVTASTRVYVQGDGRLGLLCAMVMATTGCDLTLIGRNPNKLALLQNLGNL